MANTDFTKKIYLVGGAVRDALLGLPIKDKDYVAVGFSEEDFKHLPRVGKNFPVFLQKDGSQIALARRENKTQHGYNGFSIETQQVALCEDLKRRDLTINAIAFDEATQEYYDPFNGKKDLDNKILRHVSEAFCEDPLRVLRIARFRARLGMEWKIHPNTKLLIAKMRDELRYLEKNRVYKEVESVLLGQNSHLFFESLFELGVLAVIFPSIYALTALKEGNLSHLRDSVFAHTMEVLQLVESQIASLNLSKNAHLILKFAALYQGISKSYCYCTFRKISAQKFVDLMLPLLDITLPNSIKKPMLILIKNHTSIDLSQTMRPCEYVALFESFRKDCTLLLLQIALFCADKKARDGFEPHHLGSDFKATLMQAFNAFNAYSPEEWIAQNHPSNNAIKWHVVKEKMKIVKQFLGC